MDEQSNLDQFEQHLPGDIDPEERAEILKIASQSDSIELSSELLQEQALKGDSDQQDIRSLIKDMTLPQKVKAAMFGNATCRSLLVSDAQRVVQEAVLKNPQLQEREVHDFLRNTNTPELVLRRIADSKQWMKNYTAKFLLVSNPKTPIDVGLKWIKYLRASELKRLAKSKSVPQTIANAARKGSVQRKPGA